MFTLIKAKNFKSLDNIEINFCKNKSTVNNFVAIYGENGAGKTNIVELIDFLNRTVSSRSFDAKWSGIEPPSILNIRVNMDDFYKQVLNVFLNINDYRTINEKNATELEYNFLLKNYRYTYSLKFTDKILSEELKVHRNNSQKVELLFQIDSTETPYLNEKYFINTTYNSELKEEVKKYWGKYTFLSILFAEYVNKNPEYVVDNINVITMNLIDEILSTYIYVKNNDKRALQYINLNEMKTLNLEEGKINKKYKKDLLKYEEMLNLFFTQAYSDIKEVKYIMSLNNEEIQYKLVFEKMIGGKNRQIPTTMESSGTRRLISQFNKIIMALDGKNVVIDEIDDGIHDVLMRNIILSLKEELTGQLIITTHNTLLLEVLPKEAIYLIVVDRNGKKTIQSVNDYDFRIQKNNNAKNLYLKGMFGGIPLSEYIDFEAIKEVMKDKE